MVLYPHTVQTIDNGKITIYLTTEELPPYSLAVPVYDGHGSRYEPYGVFTPAGFTWVRFSFEQVTKQS